MSTDGEGLMDSVSSVENEESKLKEDVEGTELEGSPSSPTQSGSPDSDQVIQTPNDSITPRRPDKMDAQKTPRSSGKKRLSQEEKLKRCQEKEARRLERERQQKEREAKREQEKVEKERKRKEREALRLEKERELELQREKKQREKEEKEEKKRLEAEEKQKELERKQEEKRKREEEIRAKEEDKRRKEEEKARLKLEEEQKKAKHAERFKSFFKVVEEPKAKRARTSDSVTFELKAGMSLAPILRRPELRDGSKRDAFLKEIDSNLRVECSKELLYLKSLKANSYSPRSCPRTCRRSEEKEISLLDPDECGTKQRAKLIQFHENHRPPYWGTWRKKSRKVSGRRPFGKDDTHLDYEVDSDEEWEEEPEGDDCNSDDEEEEDGEKGSDEEDGWLVEHGYLSEGEGMSDEDQQCDDPEERRKRLIAKAEAFKATVNRKLMKQAALVIGPFHDKDPSCTLDPPLYKKLHQFAGFRADGKENGEPFPTSFTVSQAAVRV